MTLKDFINKQQLTLQEEKLLIDDLHKDPESFLADSSFNEISTAIREVIEKEGLKDGDIDHIIEKKYNIYYDFAS